MWTRVSLVRVNLRYFSNVNLQFLRYPEALISSGIGIGRNPRFCSTSDCNSRIACRNPYLFPRNLFSSATVISSRACLWSKGANFGVPTSETVFISPVYTNFSRLWSGCSSGIRARIRCRSLERVSEIVEVIEKDGDDLEEVLDRMFPSLNLSVVSETFRILNLNRVSGLRFFRWVCERQSRLSRSSELCSLVIDNVGVVEDYESMFNLLKEFSGKKICLTEKAFTFLSVCIPNQDLARYAVKRIADMLNSVGGSCRNSGIQALIRMLCIANASPLAMYVMELTERRTSYYNILIWAKCRSGNFQEVRDLIDVMKMFNCEPNANSYNYIFSSLCKNKRMVDASNLLEDMEELGFLPDAITFEVVIYHLCRLGQLDLAGEYLKFMMSKGLEPRLTTHAAFIKGYFYGNRLQEAYRYVVDMGDNYRCSENLNYSLLASLFQRSRRVIEARQVLIDMIGKGLRPNFSVYMKVMKDLHRLGMRDMAVDLKSRFMKLDASNQTER